MSVNLVFGLCGIVVVDCVSTKWRSPGSPKGQQHIYRGAVAPGQEPG
jgi:hypothetical protein